jgi:GntR family transcriptional regulator
MPTTICTFLALLCVYTVYMTMHSWITISLGDPRPLYLQVIEQVKRRVAVGDLPPGTELPSIRELAAGLKVSVITIKRAYLELERDGVIATRQGKGSVVADRPGLQSSIQEDELRDHLRQAVSLGLLLGKSKTEMQRRIAEVYEQSQKGSK